MEKSEIKSKKVQYKRTIEIDINKILNTDNSPQIPESKMHRFSIAPMFDVTNVHFRFITRLLTKCSTIWTEMYNADTIANNQKTREINLQMNEIEHPVCCQLGGSDPEILSKAAIYVEEAGFDEVDINCGCPSNRVSQGAIGVVLMKSPDVVAKCLKEMKESVKMIDVHVKCRIGVDDEDSYEFLKNFVEKVKEAGCRHFIIHARKAFLDGLNPEQNRSIPPLKYEIVERLAKEFPDLFITINGGFTKFEEVNKILENSNIRGVMVGRLAMQDPWKLSDIDRNIFGIKNQGYSRREILEIYADYCDLYCKKYPDTKWPNFMKPIAFLFKGCKHGGVFKRALSDRGRHKDFTNFSQVLENCILEMDSVNKVALDERPPLND